MSKEKKEEKQEQEVKVIKGRPKPKSRSERRSGTKKLDLKKSSELFQKEFYFYWPDPTEDLEEYMDDDGNIDIDTVPNELLIEFIGRYIDPGTFLEVVNTPLSYDIPQDRQATEKELEEIIREAVQERIKNPKTEADIRCEIIQSCIIEPQFESTDQVKTVLPMDLQLELYDEITKGAIGENLVARFQEPNRK